MDVTLPGRFSVLMGANAAGKTTIADAAYLAHSAVFPRVPRPSVANLGRGERFIDVEYKYSDEGLVEGPLGLQLQNEAGRETPGQVAQGWVRTLSRDLGKVRAQQLNGYQGTERFKFIYLPAWRNPIDELARREARVLIELLRAQQQNLGKGRNLVDIRTKASYLLEQLSKDGLIQGMEERVNEHLRMLSSGVSRNWSYIRGQAVDDAYLARVLEFMLSAMEGREGALPLEVGGLGYVNLLHIAITLAAIPDLTEQEKACISQEGANVPPNEPVGDFEAEADAAARDRLLQAQAERDSEEDSFFTTAPFHATVLIEEPEAHLHPQLQHALTRYLRRITQERPEIQVILSSHSPAVITTCEPEELVVLRKLPNGRRVSRSLASIPFRDGDEVLRKTKLHMDASRSAAMFGDRILLVEGVTDAAVCREFGWAWAAGNADKQAFIDAISIVPVGTKVGSWTVRLLATRGHELCARLAVLRDSDLELSDVPRLPKWFDEHDPDVLLIQQSHPTLEPEVSKSNPTLVRDALEEIGQKGPADITPQSIYDLFRSARQANSERAYIPAGPAAKRKAEFALALAGKVRAAVPSGTVVVPEPMARIFDFLFEGSVFAFDAPSAADADGEAQANGVEEDLAWASEEPVDWTVDWPGDDQATDWWTP